MGAQMGLLRTTILWREESPIKTIKDLEGKSWAISPGQAQWYLMPAFFKINGLDFKTVKVQETAPALQPAALIAKKVDFVSVFRASNDEVTEVNAVKQGIKVRRVFMREAGLNIYGSGLIVREEDVRKRPEMIRSYIAATMEGVRYAKDNLDEAMAILLKHRPEIDRELTRTQLKNALEEVYILPESLEHGYGFMKPDVVQKTVAIANEFFEVGRKVAPNEAYTNQFIVK
jgi:NitT/TauT family transport system substrate-binding protein